MKRTFRWLLLVFALGACSSSPEAVGPDGDGEADDVERDARRDPSSPDTADDPPADALTVVLAV